MPPGSLLPRDWLLERLSVPEISSTSMERPAALVDLTVTDLSKLFARRPSTVRAWVERGDFPGAYKLHAKEWRVPPRGVEAFQNRQRTDSSLRRRVRGTSRLSNWRKVKRVDRIEWTTAGH